MSAQPQSDVTPQRGVRGKFFAPSLGLPRTLFPITPECPENTMTGACWNPAPAEKPPKDVTVPPPPETQFTEAQAAISTFSQFKNEEFFQQTAYQLLMKDAQNFIPTQCKVLDELIGKPKLCGIQRGFVSEFVGFNGTGKTQICLQLAASAILLGGKALYIDTKGAFSIERFLDITRGLFPRMQTYKSLDYILNRLLYTFTSKFADYNETIQKLDTILTENPEITFVAVDSYSWYCNCMPNTGGEKSMRRTRAISEYLMILQRCAQQFNVAVVITNSMTTRFTKDGEKTFIASLGEQFYHRVSQRIFLSKVQDRYYATLEKSLCNPSKTYEFKITAAGVE